MKDDTTTDDRLLVGEKIIRRGGNQTGSYVVICNGRSHWVAWAAWGTDCKRYKGPCDCDRRRDA